MNEIILVLGGAVGGIFIGFGVRGLLELNKNKDVKGYKAFWEKKEVKQNE